jgi:phospholipase/carboxylesterase
MAEKGHVKRLMRAGTPPGDAAGLLLMLHGRGASASDILGLAPSLHAPGFAWWAPEAANSTWYPYPFISPPAMNEPWLSSAIGLLSEIVADAATAGFPPEKIWLIGFSQGACLSVEYAARSAQRWGGVGAFSGGLIGDRLYQERYGGDLAGTPVFLGSSDPDPHIPVSRVHESAALLKSMNANVVKRIYPEMGHTISYTELQEANTHLFGA